MSRENVNQQNIGPLLIGGGSAVILISLFLSWISVSADGRSVSESLWKFNPDGGHHTTGLVIIVCVLALVLAGMLFLQGQTRVLPALGGVGLVLAGMALGLAAEFVGTSSGGSNSGAGAGVGAKVSAGFGAYLAVLAGLTVLFGAWRTLAIDNSAFSGIAGAVRGAASGARTAAAGARTSTAGARSTASPQQVSTPQPSHAGETDPLEQGVAPGWYPDPSGQHRERLWDGNAWTEQVR